MRYIIQQGRMFVAESAATGIDPDGSYVALTDDPKKAHDFLGRLEAEKWLLRKGLPGKIIEIDDGAHWCDVTHEK